MNWKKISTPTLLFLALASAAGMRSANYAHFINPAGGYYFPYNMDAYEHLRRIILGVHSFPGFPVFDSYAGYPMGTGQLWPPLFDYLLSTASLLFGGSRATTETVGFFANPFFSAVTVLLLYFVAKRMFGNNTAGIAAAFFLAFNPGHLAYTLGVKLDHHVLEPIAVLLLVMVPIYEKKERIPVKGQLLVAASLVTTIFLWRGSTLYWIITFVSASIRAFTGRKLNLLRDYAAAFALAAVPVAAICILNPWGTANGLLSSVISWFHVLVLLLLAMALLLLSTRFSIKRTWFAVIGFSILISAALSLGPVRAFIREFAVAGLFLRGAGDPWIASMNEMQVTFSSGILNGASLLTVFWFVVPLAAVMALRKWDATNRTDDGVLNFSIWSVIFLLGFRFRYIHVAGVISSLAFGYLLMTGVERWQGLRRVAYVALMAVSVLVPGYSAYRTYVTLAAPPALQEALFSGNGIFNWIREKTPKTSFLFSPTSRPEYGILADWSFSPLVYYLAERPALATGFGWETHGFYEQAGFFATDIPAIALSLAKGNGIRYVLVGRKSNYLEHYYLIAAEGEKKRRLPRGTTAEYRPMVTMYVRLADRDGSLYLAPEGLIRACGNYRLLHEQQVNDGGNLKVFEVVNGATIRGRGVPNSAVDIHLPLVTTGRRRFSFHDRTTTNGNGTFTFLVPYSTDGKQGDTSPLAPYTLSGSGITIAQVRVTENEVVQGRSIVVP